MMDWHTIELKEEKTVLITLVSVKIDMERFAKKLRHQIKEIEND